MASCDIVYDMIKRTLKRKLPSENDDIPAKALKTFFQESVTPGFCYTAGAEHALSKVTCMFAFCVASAAKSVAKRKNSKRIFGNDVLTAVNNLRIERFLGKINECLPEYLSSLPGNDLNPNESGETSEIPNASAVLDEVITIDSDTEDGEIVPDNSDNDDDEEEDADSEDINSVDFNLSGSDNEKNGDSDSSVEICEANMKSNENQIDDKNTSTNSIDADKTADNNIDNNDEVTNNVKDNTKSDESENKNTEASEVQERNIENNVNSSPKKVIERENIAADHTVNTDGSAENGEIDAKSKDKANDLGDACEESISVPNKSGVITDESKINEAIDATDITENTTNNERSDKNNEIGKCDDHVNHHSKPEMSHEKVSEEIQANSLENGDAS